MYNDFTFDKMTFFESEKLFTLEKKIHYGRTNWFQNDYFLKLYCGVCIGEWVWELILLRPKNGKDLENFVSCVKSQPWFWENFSSKMGRTILASVQLTCHVTTLCHWVGKTSHVNYVHLDPEYEYRAKHLMKIIRIMFRGQMQIWGFSCPAMTCSICLSCMILFKSVR